MYRVGVIYRIGFVDDEIAELLARTLSHVFEDVKFYVGPTLQPPIEAYDWSRRQYRSELILEMLRRAGKPQALILGVAGVDAYADALNFVFGEAILGGGVAVVYTRRLDPRFYGREWSEKLFFERLLKESMHELGHAIGLEHCDLPGCVMSFSNSIIEVDAKQLAFCSRCAGKLASIGIRVSRRFMLNV